MSTLTFGRLSTTNPIFRRPNSSNDNYYYDSFNVTVSISDTYSFTSSNAGLIDMYGCLYERSFDASYPLSNLLICDDDKAGGLQFLIRQYLYKELQYILVVTTYQSGETVSYTIEANGPSRVLLLLTTPSK